MEKIKYVTKQFHLWPFYGLRWRGFLPTYSIEINDSEIEFRFNNHFINRYKPEDICLAVISNTWFGYGKTKIGFAEEYNSVEKRGNQWHFLRKYNCYLSPESLDQAIQSFKEANVKCFKQEAVSLRDGNLWMCADKVVEYEGISKKNYWALDTSELKYFYTQRSMIPFAKPVLITGSDHVLRIKKLNRNDVEILKQHVIDNGAMLGDISNASFTDTFSMKVLYSPSLWFTSSSIGLSDKGVTYNLKTFRTTDNIFIPYEKINFATSTGSWYQRTRSLFIFGEQNILPRKRFKIDDVKRIVEELREKGVSKLEGSCFPESYHSSVWGIIFCFLTVGLWHCIVMAATKRRNSIMIGDKIFGWDGDLWLIDFDNKQRVKPDQKIKLYAGNVSDIKSIYYYKKHWFHLWGSLYIWTRPRNLRTLAYEASQEKQDYDLEMSKVWFWNVKQIRKELVDNGFERNADSDKDYRIWVKYAILNKK